MPSNIDAMQQEAMRRVQEMHSRTHNAVRRTSAPTVNSPAPAANIPVSPTAEAPAAHNDEKPRGVPAQNENRALPQNDPIGAGKNLLETVFHDKERSLILLLILILANENTTPEALLALMYLVM